MASDQQFCLRWNNHQNTLVSIFDSLLESGTLVDCTLAAEGRFLQAHKVVLSACSPYFAMLLREHYDKFPILILKDIKYQELQAMMNYMYRGEVNITQETLGSFLKAAESLQIRGLTDNSQCVENNNGIIRDNNSLHEARSIYSHSNKKLSADSRKLHNSRDGGGGGVASATPLISQQRSRSPPSFVTQTQSSKKYLKSSQVVIENHHHAAAAAVAAAAAAAVAAANNTNHHNTSNSKSSADMLENNSHHNSHSIKRRKLLPPIKSEGLVVTPINPSTTPSTYNNIEASNVCEVPSQAQSIPAAFEGKANVPSPSIPPKIESPHMDITPVICNKVPPIVNNTPNAVAAAAMADGLIKSKSSAASDMVKVKSEQLEDSYNEDTNDDSYTTEDNDNERDENSHLSMSGLPFHNNQSGSNFDSSTDRSLLAQDGSSLQDSPARITITREQSLKLQKLLHEKPVGHRKFTDFEVRRNASRLKIPAVKIRYWLKKRNAYVEEGTPAQAPAQSRESRSLSVVVPKTRLSSVVVPASQDDEISFIGVKYVPRRSKLLNEISFEKKVQLLKKTMTTMNVSTRLSRELAQELQIDENRIYSWLKAKVQRNLNMKRSLTANELSALRGKFAEYDYLDDDTALVLADRFNVPVAVIKKAFQQHKPASSTPKNVPKPVVHIRKLPIVALKSMTSSKASRRSPKMKPVGEGGSSKKNPSFKTVDQKNLLFEAFRQSPTLTKNDTVAELVTATGLQTQQITKWLSMFRTKWAHNSESGLKKALTRGLTQDQLVEMERAYRGDRFLTHEQLAELAKTVNLTMKALQAWFNNRRVYEIRSCDKDLVNIGPKTAAARKESSLPLQQPQQQPQKPQKQPQPQQVVAQPANSVVADNAEFFESLTKEQKALLKAGCTNFNVSYSRLAQVLGVPAEKIKQYIIGYRIRHSIFRQTNRSIPERVHKSLLNHIMKYGKISGKTNIALAKRLKIRPEQVRSWSKTYTSRILEHNRPVQRPAAIAAAPQPVPVAPAAVTTQQPAVEEVYEEPAAAASSAAGPKSSARKSLVSSKHVVPSAAKNALLAEFLKSPQTVANNMKELAKMAGITPVQVNNWFHSFSKRLSEQNKSQVVAFVTNNPAISDQQRARLEAAYRNCRYLEVPEMEALTAETGVRRKLLESWFINARYYEVLTGQPPGGPGETKTASKSTKTSKSFYEDLNSQQRERLNEELASYPLDNQRLEDLANELQVPSNELKKWFDKACRSRTRSRSLPNLPRPLNLPAKVLEMLTKEFEIDPILPEVRAGALAKRTRVTKDRIKAWFANRQQEMHKFEENEQADERKLVKHRIPPIRITIPKYVATNGDVGDTTDYESTSKKSYFQQNRLFEEFKMDQTLTNERLIKISKETNLDAKQISAWFDWIKAKLASIPRESLLEENRNGNLNARQIAVLEEEYTKNRYVDRTVRESLSRSLGVSKNVVKTWFASKRYSEILCQDESLDSDPLSPRNGDFDDEEDSARQTETPIDYGWDEEEAVYVDDGAEAEVEHKLDLKRPVEIDPLLDYSFQDGEPNNEDVKTNISYNFQLSANSAFADNLTSLPYQPRNRLFTRLGKDLEPLEADVDELFRFHSKTPNKPDARFDQEIDEEKDRILEGEFSKNPWPELDAISQLSAQLLVSEPKIHWWFIKKRCFLTKTILNVPSPKPKPKAKPKSAPKNVLIDLTVEDGDSAQSPKCGEFEFVTLEETGPIKEEEAAMTEEEDEIEIEDPSDDDVTEEHPSTNEESSQYPIVTNAMEVETPFVEPFVDPIDNAAEEQTLDPIDTNAMEVQSPFNEPSVDPIATNNVDVQSSINESSRDPIDTNATVDQSSINDLTRDPLSIDDTITNSTTISATLKKKPKKIPLTTHQRAVLKQEFKRNKIISNAQALLLAHDLGLTVGRIETWFENMRIKRTSASVKNLSPEIEAGLEEEYSKSVNLSNKRAKMIAIKLNTRKKIVQKWFVERAKRVDGQQPS